MELNIHGGTTLIDDDDLGRVSALRWYLGRNGYIARHQHLGMVDGRQIQRLVLLHRFIVDAPAGRVVDHINRNPLDNRKSNLRIVSQSENMMNRSGPNSNSTTGVLGVTFDKERRRFIAQINLHGRHKFLGRFRSLEEAAQAAAVARKEK